VSYVDAGYIAALGALFLYAVGLGLQRRRLERAYRASVTDAVATRDGNADDAVAPGGRP
jgi:hypothetical protein